MVSRLAGVVERTPRAPDMPIRSGCGYVRFRSISGADSGEPISKQGWSLVRWSAVEAVSGYHGGAEIRDLYQRVAERRGRSIGRVAAARKLLTLVYYGLRDGEIRCLRDAA